MPKSKGIPSIVCAMLLLGVEVAAAGEDEIHTCRDADGNVSFQSDPCPAAPVKVAPPAPPPRRRVASPAPPKPAPSKRSRATARTTDWVRLTPVRSTAGPRSARKLTFPVRLDGAATAGLPSFVSPEHTWRSFLVAIDTGDATAAAACLTPSALADLGAPFPLHDLRAMVATFVSIEDEGQLGPFWSIHAARHDLRPKWILFEQLTEGEWKISGI